MVGYFDQIRDNGLILRLRGHAESLSYLLSAPFTDVLPAVKRVLGRNIDEFVPGIAHSPLRNVLADDTFAWSEQFILVNEAKSHVSHLS
jgi:hypothetical protein